MSSSTHTPSSSQESPDPTQILARIQLRYIPEHNVLICLACKSAIRNDIARHCGRYHPTLPTVDISTASATAEQLVVIDPKDLPPKPAMSPVLNFLADPKSGWLCDVCHDLLGSPFARNRHGSNAHPDTPPTFGHGL
ncbi:unnamed protein product [Tilletia laevis]|uniref:C2H2-type domain-containing protein n=2 Tax=Tilletia TaxID=13289 RepID=A0A177V672_9BASI|nr:hypothetical protein CF336_g8547 [Tilletia laevis]KAE8241659.1 hypothetical protein A4X03_0g8110 [Tilletia caries]CAD6970099.1 unnamed protein product [Tilletia controversa]KAE8183843.1 hypothetical protein CF335_g8203 [Tilletia laevis]CAD6924186.1 unnamed protein product [Tilletia laevis]